MFLTSYEGLHFNFQNKNALFRNFFRTQTKTFKTFLFAPFNTKQTLNKQSSRNSIMGAASLCICKNLQWTSSNFICPLHLSVLYSDWDKRKWIESILSSAIINPLAPDSAYSAVVHPYHLACWLTECFYSCLPVHYQSRRMITCNVPHIKWLIVAFVYFIASSFLNCAFFLMYFNLIY